MSLVCRGAWCGSSRAGMCGECGLLRDSAQRSVHPTAPCHTCPRDLYVIFIVYTRSVIIRFQSEYEIISHTHNTLYGETVNSKQRAHNAQAPPRGAPRPRASCAQSAESDYLTRETPSHAPRRAAVARGSESRNAKRRERRERVLLLELGSSEPRAGTGLSPHMPPRPSVALAAPIGRSCRAHWSLLPRRVPRMPYIVLAPTRAHHPVSREAHNSRCGRAVGTRRPRDCPA